jgi:hypothetical protein
MIGLRCGNLVLASAVALLAVSLAAPAQAESDTSQNAAGITEVSSADVPTPRARPAVRKRVVSTAPVYRPVEPYRVARPYVGPRYTMLILGVGY